MGYADTMADTGGTQSFALDQDVENQALRLAGQFRGHGCQAGQSGMFVLKVLQEPLFVLRQRDRGMMAPMLLQPQSNRFAADAINSQTQVGDATDQRREPDQSTQPDTAGCVSGPRRRTAIESDRRYPAFRLSAA